MIKWLASALIGATTPAGARKLLCVAQTVSLTHYPDIGHTGSVWSSKGQSSSS